MIRTGIYDGHTPGPWKLDDRIWEMYLGLEPDVMLMQDAPLLLAEVKRLYEMMDVLASFHMVKNVEQGFTQRDWVELVELAKRGEEE
tara:strand:- start:155 stop:415 length:261 start_codon:yes stop_codon:yes gene_type:complete